MPRSTRGYRTSRGEGLNAGVGFNDAAPVTGRRQGDKAAVRTRVPTVRKPCSRRLEISYLSPLVADDPEEAQQHLTVIDEGQIEKKRPRADRPGRSEVEGVEQPLLGYTAARHIPEDLQKSKAVLYKKARAGDSSRRRVVRLDETPPEQQMTNVRSAAENHNPSKKWSLRDVFGDKLNLVDGDRRALLEAFLNKGKKPPSADTNRVKIHEETAYDPATGQVTKTTLYVLLDWEKHSYQKTRKLKVVPPVMAPVPAGLAAATSSQHVESAAS